MPFSSFYRKRSANDILCTATFGGHLISAYIDKFLLDRGIKNALRIIAQAQYQSDMLYTKLGRHADTLMPNFYPDKSVACEKEQPVVILWKANIKPKKRPDEFIRLAPRYSDRTDMRFVMLGRPTENRYQRKIDQLLAGCNNMEMRGELPIEEVNRLLCSASTFVNTSIFEGFPNTFVQAWFRAVPVVSLQSDPDDVISRNDLGFHSGDFKLLREHIDLLVHDRSRREEIGKRVRDFALAIHSEDKNIGDILSLIEKELA